ncbi:hypothetical protein [Kribbella sp. NPDC051620]|uniref:hypothetical protein n=1 Tax=Kribbella sp. NPDC051620 TaxID=3364120 RepID=UPI00378EB755
MFGGRLPRNTCGQVMVGISAGVANGRSTLIKPTHEVAATGEELVLDGVRFVFQFVPETEAPTEMNFHRNTARYQSTRVATITTALKAGAV